MPDLKSGVGHQWIFPSQCVCCCGPAETKLGFETNKRVLFGHIVSKIQVPFCNFCAKHQSKQNISLGILIVMMFIGIMFCIFFIVALDGYLSVAAVVVLVGFVWLMLKLIAKQVLSPSGFRRPSCVEGDSPFSFSVEKNQVTLHFGSGEYANLFLTANPNVLKE